MPPFSSGIFPGQISTTNGSAAGAVNATKIETKHAAAEARGCIVEFLWVYAPTPSRQQAGHFMRAVAADVRRRTELMDKRVRLLTSAATDRERFTRGMRYPCQATASRDVAVEADGLAGIMRTSYWACPAVRTMAEMNRFGSCGQRHSAVRQSWRADHADALELRNTGIAVCSRFRSTVPAGLVLQFAENPALKRWAIINCPSGTRAGSLI